MSRRSAGTGQVEKLPSGRYRVRLTIDGKRRDLGTYETEPEAQDALDGARHFIAEGQVRVTGGLTLANYGRQWLDRIDLEGRSGVEKLRGVWEKHLAPSALGGAPIPAIRRAHVRAWHTALLKEGLRRSTARLYLGYVRQCLDSAVEDEIIAHNPALVRDRRRRIDRVERDEAWTYLDLAEQKALLACAAIPFEHRLFLGFLIGTGLRIGEAISLRWEDVHITGPVPRVVVRYGGPPRKPTKTGRTREVPLFGIGLEALQRWAELRSEWAPHNPHELAFPSRRGAFRQRQYPFGGNRGKPKFPQYLQAVGISRRVRIHDLRHTCASSLIAGWWGRTWALIEVRDFLGHENIATTQRYAHLAASTLARVASETKPTASPRELFQGAQPLEIAVEATSRSSASGRSGGSSRGSARSRSSNA